MNIGKLQLTDIVLFLCLIVLLFPSKLIRFFKNPVFRVVEQVGIAVCDIGSRMPYTLADFVSRETVIDQQGNERMPQIVQPDIMYSGFSRAFMKRSVDGHMGKGKYPVVFFDLSVAHKVHIHVMNYAVGHAYRPYAALGLGISYYIRPVEFDI